MEVDDSLHYKTTEMKGKEETKIDSIKSVSEKSISVESDSY
jgi:hypothetical protein